MSELILGLKFTQKQYIVLIADIQRRTFAPNLKKRLIHLYIITTTDFIEYMLCPCEINRQLNSIQQPTNHKPNSSKYFTGQS